MKINEQFKANRYLKKSASLQRSRDYYIATGNTVKANEIEQKIKDLTKSYEDLLSLQTQQNKVKINASSNLTNDEENNQKINYLITKDKAFESFTSDSSIHLEISNLTMRFGGLKAVDNLSFSVKKGEIFGLIGPNGAGKTTVFNCITQFYKPTEGTILFRDKNNSVHELTRYNTHDIIPLGMVRTFQNVELIWELTVLENMLVGAHSLYSSNFLTQLLHLPKLKFEENMIKNRALEILDKMGILAYKDMYPVGLPYGILKKIEIARTLITNPKLIILDEPAAGLNDSETLELAQTIKRIRDEFGLTIFLVEHDMGLVMDICDTICAISFGKKLAIGTPSEIQNDAYVQEAYLGGK